MRVPFAPAFVSGDAEKTETALKVAIHATVGFKALAERTGFLAPSLMRMVSRCGNPTLNNVVCIMTAPVLPQWNRPRFRRRPSWA